MSVILISGAAGLAGSESYFFFAEKGFDVVGVDNDMRRYFSAKTAARGGVVPGWSATPRYRHVDADIRDAGAIDRTFAEFGRAIAVVIHAAAQPSHDWAVREPERILRSTPTAR